MQTEHPSRSRDSGECTKESRPTAQCLRSLSVHASGMILDGNSISCDAFGCRNRDEFVGELAPEDVLARFHVLGWSFDEVDGRTVHYCPDHG